MTKHHVSFKTKPTSTGFTLDSPAATAPAAISPLGEAREYQIDIPKGDSVEIQIDGFSVDTVTYSLSAVSQIVGRSEIPWQRVGSAALSPEFSENADHNVVLVAAGGNGTTRRIPSVTMKIRQPGKPDGFLDRF